MKKVFIITLLLTSINLLAQDKYLKYGFVTKTSISTDKEHTIWEKVDKPYLVLIDLNVESISIFNEYTDRYFLNILTNLTDSTDTYNATDGLCNEYTIEIKYNKAITLSITDKNNLTTFYFIENIKDGYPEKYFIKLGE